MRPSCCTCNILELFTDPSCSRGIGFEIVKQLASDPSNEVFATCRDPDSAFALKSLAKLHVVKLDVNDEASIRWASEAVSRILGDKGLDYLINNAGIVSPLDHLHFSAHPPFDQIPAWDHPFTTTLANLQAAFTSNLAGPLLISQAFLHLIEKSERKVLAHITTCFASFTQLDAGTCDDILASYSITKVGLNMLVRCCQQHFILWADCNGERRCVNKPLNDQILLFYALTQDGSRPVSTGPQ